MMIQPMLSGDLKDSRGQGSNTDGRKGYKLVG
jgi:hypothetical protein